MFFDIHAYLNKLTEAAERYQKTAPTVSAHIEDLYIRISESPAKVSLAELDSVAQLWNDDWEHPNYAANRIYHLRERLGMDTIGQAGF